MNKIYLVIIILFVFFISSCYANSKNDLYYALKNNTNYTYIIEDDDGNQREYIYNETNIEVTLNDGEIKKLTYCNSLSDTKYIVKTSTDGICSKVDPSEEEFDQLLNKYFIVVHLNVLLSKEFNFNGIVYSLNIDLLNSVCNKVFCDSINGEFKKFELIVENQKVKEMIVTYDGGIKDATLKINFYGYGFSVVDVPEINKDKVITNIEPSVKLLTVMLGTTLDDAVSDLFIYVTYEYDYLVYDLTSFEYTSPTYECNVPGKYELVVNVFGEEVGLLIEVIDAVYYIPNNIENIQEYGVRKNLSYGLPSTGNPRVLVIPVEFTDYKAPLDMKSNLEKAFFGKEEDTGWESLKSYYSESSYGKLNICGTVLDVFNTGNTSTYYESKFKKGENADYMIIKEALKYYDSQINYDEYDSNGDGYIDALYIMYTTPVNYTDSDSMWWAYTYEYFTNDREYYDNVEADYYCFIGYEFFYETPANNIKIKLNTETIIHETGHLLGIVDYYDYDDSVGPDGGLGGGDMMDYNVGDHNPFTKILLGWVTPYVVTSSCSLDLEPFYKTGQCIILTDNFTSIYDEYYLIDFYRPNGLNKFEAGNAGLFSTSGIRIYHVNAGLADEEVVRILDIFKYNNSYTSFKLLKLIEASNNMLIENGSLSNNYDLFNFNKYYTLDDYFINKSLKFKFKATLKSTQLVKIEIEKL